MIDPEWLKQISKDGPRCQDRIAAAFWVVAPLVEDSKAVGAILESKEGRVAVRAAVVDTTGDGDVFVRAGEGYEGDIDTDNIHHCANTPSLLSGVDVHKWFAWQDQNPDLYKDFMKRGREATKHFILPFAG